MIRHEDHRVVGKRGASDVIAQAAEIVEEQRLDTGPDDLCRRLQRQDRHPAVGARIRTESDLGRTLPAGASRRDEAGNQGPPDHDSAPINSRKN